MKLSILIPVYNQEELVINALEHIPRRDDIEVLVRDDGSTDSTLANLLAYKDTHPGLNLKVYSNGQNRGVAYTKNRLFEDAVGEYFHVHDSDDYVDTPKYNVAINLLDGADVYTMNLIVNSGKMLDINVSNDGFYCAQIARFIRRDFAEGIRWPEDVRAGDDGYYAVELMKKTPKIVYTRIPAYHYNFPREGSLCDLRAKGVLP